MKSFTKTLMLALALCLGWAANAQDLAEYEFATGVDASAWLTPASQTTIVTSGQDDGVSGVQNLGFSFPYCGQVYTQFSANSNGRIRLGSTAISTEYGNPFTSSYYSNNNPKLSPIGKDQSSGGAGYVKYGTTTVNGETVGVVNFKLNNSSSASGTTYNEYQIQLFQSGKIRFVYGTLSSAADYQIGLSSPVAGEIVTVNPSTHTASYSGGTYVSTTTSVMPGTNRYYEFAMPNQACPRPTDWAATATANEVTLTWAAIDTVSAWNVFCGTDTVTGITDTFYTFTGLDANTVYTVGLQAMCDNDSISRWNTLSVRTSCVALTDQELPFTEGFESYTTGESDDFIPCWNRLGSTAKRPYVYNGNAHNSSKSLYFFASNGATDHCVAILPPVDGSSLNMTDLAVSFYARQWSTSYDCDVTVGIMTNPNDLNTFVPVGVVHPNGINYEYFEVAFASYTGTGTYVALSITRHAGYSSSIYMAIDDITLDYAPTCLRVDSLQLESLSSSAITATWVPVGDESAWSVRLLQGDSVVDYQIVSSTDYTWTDLLPTTTYTVEVNAYCGGDDSSAVNAASIRTACYDFLPIPFDYGFEDLAASQSPFCGYANRRNSTSTMPYASSTGTAYDGSWNLYMYTPSAGTQLYWYAVGPVDLDENSMEELYVSFIHGSAPYNSSTYSSIVRVGLMENPNDLSTFVPMATFDAGMPSVNNTCNWYEREVYFNNLDDSLATYAYICFATPVAPALNNYSIIDNVHIGPAPSCQRPGALMATNVTANEATIHWNGGTAPFYVYYGSPLADTSENASPLTVYEDSITLTDLMPNSTYQVFVQGDCGGELSEMSLPVAFRTECGDQSLPYMEDFNSYTGATGTGHIMHCWTILQTPGTYPYICTGTYARSGYGIQFGGASGSTYARAATPRIMCPANEITMEFWKKSETTSGSSGSLLVGWMADLSYPMDSIITVGTFAANTSWVRHELDFSTVAAINQRTDTGYVVFWPNGTASNYYTGLDDIVIEQANPCQKPQNLAVSGVTDEEATITWTSNPYASGYNLIVSSSPVTDFDNYDGNMENLSDNSFLADQLSPNTLYYVYAQTDCGDGYSNWQSTTFRTACAPIASEDMPYHYGFDDATGSGSSYAINSCWQKFTNSSTNYPYPSSSYRHDGNYSLYFYSTTTPYHSYAVMPLFEDSINTLMVTFWRYGSSSSYGRIKVGVMTNPADISTFEEVANLPATGTTWTEATVGFADYTGHGRYIAFYSDPSALNYVYLDDITVSSLPECPFPVDFAADNITGTGAVLTWDYQHGIATNVPDSYDLEIEEVGTGSVTTEYGVSSPYLLSGLQPSTAYKVRVIAYCNSDEGGRDSVTFSTGCLMGGDIEIVRNAATTNNYTIPMNTFYNYSWTQQLVLSSELGNVDTILGIAFDYAYATPLTGQTCSIYVANTSLTALSTSSYVNPSQMTLVYSGPFNCTQGWNSVQFTTPFISNGQNIVVSMYENASGHPGSSYVFATQPATGKTISFYSDSQCPDLSSLSSYSGSKTTYAYRNHMRFLTPCNNDVSCIPPTVVLDSVVEGTIGISWAPGLYESSWDVDYRQAGAATWTNLLTGTSQQSAVLTGLNANTTYDIRVTALCATGDTAAAYLSATTPCAAFSVPFSEDFSSWTTATTYFNPCWHRGTNYTTSYPYASASYGQSLYLYSTSSTWSYCALPLFDVAIDSLAISFDVYRSNTSYAHRFEVGVMTNPSDVTTFQRVAWVVPTLSSQYERFEVSFANYTGNGRYIALRSPDGEYSYPYIDNILVERLSSCPRPTDVTLSGITQTSVNVSWTSQSTEFEVEYGPAGFQHGQGTVVNSLTNSVALTGLNASSQYEVYVRAICDAGDTSNWSFVTRFATQCGLMQIPFSESFDNWGTGSTVMPNCWNRVGSTADRPYIYTSSSYAYGGTGYSLYYYGEPTGYCYAVMPESSVPVNQLQVRFAARQWSTSYQNGVVVGVMTSPTNQSSFVAVDTVYPTFGTTNYELFEVSLDQYTGQGAYIALGVVTQSGSYLYMAVDEVSVDYIPACPRMTNLTATNVTSSSIDLGWTDPSGNSTQWQIEYGPTGFQQGQGTFVTVTSNPYTLTLPAGYQGEFYVRPFCSATDTGMWNYTPCGIYTAQVAATLPYLCDFDTDDATHDSWSNWQQVSNSPLHWAAGSAGAYQSNSGLYLTDNDSNAVPAHLGVSNITAYRDIDFGTVDSSYTIEFDFNCGGRVDGNYDGLMIFVVDDFSPVEASSTGLMSPWGHINEIDRVTFQRRTNGWTHVTATIDNVSGIKRLGLYYFYQNTVADNLTGFGEMAKIDNLEIDYASCARPYDLDVDNITGTTAHLFWHGDATTNYIVTYRVYGTTGQDQSIQVTGNSYTLTGLLPSTEYAYWVRKQCGGDWSDYSLGIRFQTECGIVTEFPWTENFNSTPATTYSSAGQLPNCWLGWTDGSATYFPHVVGSGLYWYSPDSTNSLCMTSGSPGATTYGSNKLVALPQFAGQVGDLTLRFWYKQESATNGSTLTVGYFTSDSLSMASFVPVRVMPAQATGVYDSVSFDTVANPAALRIGFHWTYTSSYYSCCVDDVTVESAALFCLAPTTSVVSTDWNQATVSVGNITGQAEIELRAATQATWGAAENVTGSTHTFTNLQPETSYQYRVRQECPEIGYSDYAYGTFTTDELPCFVPENLTADAQGTTATLTWTASNQGATYQVRYAAQGDTLTAAAATNSAELTNLRSNTTYTAWVRALCGDGTVESDWSEPATFTTRECEPVSGITISNITATGATVSWTSTGSATAWKLNIGEAGHPINNYLQEVDVTGQPSYTITGLEPGTEYDVLVKAVCGEGWVSEDVRSDRFTTLEGSQSIDQADATAISLYPNPATTEVTIEGYEGEVVIVDMTGRVVLSQEITPHTSHLSLLNLPSGAYFVKMGTEVKKLIVK